MKNFILIHHFENKKDNEFFKSELKKKYPENKIDQQENFEYFAFPARHEPAVKDEVNEITHRISIGTKDYVALYYTKPKKDDQIIREMLLGSESLIETKVKKVPKHQENLIQLIEHDFLRERNKS